MPNPHLTAERHAWPLLVELRGWSIYRRAVAGHILRVWIAAPKNVRGRYWLGFSINRGHWLRDSNLAAFARRHPHLVDELAADLTAALAATPELIDATD